MSSVKAPDGTQVRLGDTVYIDGKPATVTSFHDMATSSIVVTVGGETVKGVSPGDGEGSWTLTKPESTKKKILRKLTKKK